MIGVITVLTFVVAFSSIGRLFKLWRCIRGDAEISIWDEEPNTKLGIFVAFLRLVQAMAVLLILIGLGNSLKEINTLEERLSEANAARSDTATQLNELTNVYNSEREDYQSQIKSLSDKITLLETENDELKEANSTISQNTLRLRTEKSEMKAKLDFYEEYAVIVADDGSKFFHQYGKHSGVNYSSFWIYNTEAAKGKGYHPCTQCYQSGYYIGNVSSGVYHRPSCGSLPSVWNRTYFEDKYDALSAGYHSCGNCRP